MQKLIAAIFLLFLFSNSAEAKITAGGLFRCTNEIRKEYNLKPLRNNRLLAEVASMKAEDIATYKYWAHMNPVSKQWTWPMFDQVGYIYKTAGENLAIGYNETQEVCNAWKASDLHFKNLIHPKYADIGFAMKVVDLGEKKGLMIVQIFGSR